MPRLQLPLRRGSLPWSGDRLTCNRRCASWLGFLGLPSAFRQSPLFDFCPFQDRTSSFAALAHCPPQVGNLGLAVGTLEQALEGLDVSDRLAQHEAQLRELRSSSDELRASLGEQLCSQDERLLGLAQQLAGAEAAALKAQAAGEKLREAVRQQLEQWREEAAALMAPLAARLEGLEAQATAGLGELRAEVQAALEAQPGRWAADTERAIQPLQHEICSLEQALQAAAEAAAGASVALCALCKDVAQHPAQWAAAIEAVSVELQQQLAEVKSRQVADAQVKQ